MAEARDLVVGVSVRAEAQIKAEADTALFDALLDDFEYGNCPGSKLKVGNQEIWLYTEKDVTGWLRAAQKARLEPADD